MATYKVTVNGRNLIFRAHDKADAMARAVREHNVRFGDETPGVEAIERIEGDPDVGAFKNFILIPG